MSLKSDRKVRKKAMARHAVTRLFERFFMYITFREYDQLCHSIKNSEPGCESVGTGYTNNETFHFLTIYGERVVALYDKDFDRIRTFYKVEYYEDFMDKHRR